MYVCTCARQARKAIWNEKPRVVLTAFKRRSYDHWLECGVMPHGNDHDQNVFCNNYDCRVVLGDDKESVAACCPCVREWLSELPCTYTHTHTYTHAYTHTQQRHIDIHKHTSTHIFVGRCPHCILCWPTGAWQPARPWPWVAEIVWSHPSLGCRGSQFPSRGSSVGRRCAGWPHALPDLILVLACVRVVMCNSWELLWVTRGIACGTSGLHIWFSLLLCSTWHQSDFYFSNREECALF